MQTLRRVPVQVLDWSSELLVQHFSVLDVQTGKLKLLFVAPERLNNYLLLQALSAHLPLEMIVVDGTLTSARASQLCSMICQPSDYNTVPDSAAPKLPLPCQIWSLAFIKFSLLVDLEDSSKVARNSLQTSDLYESLLFEKWCYVMMSEELCRGSLRIRMGAQFQVTLLLCYFVLCPALQASFSYLPPHL